MTLKDADEKLATTGQIGRLDLTKIIVPRAIARVRSGLMQPKVMQRPDGLLVTWLIAPDSEHSGSLRQPICLPIG